MKTLFAISVVALVALLWASVSIARHVRMIRRKRRTVAAEKAAASRPAPPPIPYANPAERQESAIVSNNFGDLSDPYAVRRSRHKDTASQ